MLLPFGKYKGREVNEAPTHYLEWLYENVALYGKLGDEVCMLLGKEPLSRANKKVDELKARHDAFMKLAGYGSDDEENEITLKPFEDSRGIVE